MKLRTLWLVVMVGACTNESASNDEAANVADLGTLSAPHSEHGSHALRLAVCRGAQRIVDQQADITGDNAHNGLVDTDPDDGGWDFTIPAGTSHTAAVSFENLYGGTALGLWAAHEAGCDSMRITVGALDAGVGMQHRPEVDSPPDFVFGVQLAALAENPGFAELARARYDAKVAANGGAAGLGTLIKNFRHAGHADALIPYDLGWLVISTAALDVAFPNAGYHADADTYAGIANGSLVLDDSTQRFYITGVAWAQITTAWLHDPAFAHARQVLLDAQLADGGWFSDSTHPDDDLQSTAHALQTLALTGDGHASRKAQRRGARWLVQAQAASGGWIDPGNTETPLVEGDIVLGLVLSQTGVGDDGLVPDAPFVAHPHAQLTPAAPLQ